jgi:hypothetical protein
MPTSSPASEGNTGDKNRQGKTAYELVDAHVLFSCAWRAMQPSRSCAASFFHREIYTSVDVAPPGERKNAPFRLAPTPRRERAERATHFLRSRRESHSLSAAKLHGSPTEMEPRITPARLAQRGQGVGDMLLPYPTAIVLTALSGPGPWELRPMTLYS